MYFTIYAIMCSLMYFFVDLGSTKILKEHGFVSLSTVPDIYEITIKPLEMTLNTGNEAGIHHEHTFTHFTMYSHQSIYQSLGLCHYVGTNASDSLLWKKDHFCDALGVLICHMRAMCSDAFLVLNRKLGNLKSFKCTVND